MEIKSLTEKSCGKLRGVGPKTKQILQDFGYESAHDLIFHLPYRYEDRTQIRKIASIKVGETVLIEARVLSVEFSRHRKNSLSCVVADDSGELLLRFYHAHAYMQRQYSVGKRLRCFGQVSQQRQLEMIHPECQLNPAQSSKLPTTLTPVYRLPAGISQNKMRDLIEQVLVLLPNIVIHSVIPAAYETKWQLMSLTDALLFTHHPPAETPSDQLMHWQTPAQQRVIIEELLSARLRLLAIRKGITTKQSVAFQVKGPLCSQGLAQLPYPLTAGQKQAIQVLETELNRPYPMQRLLQGDVGCGKTVVALAACLMACDSGVQSVLMVPTELLAMQHTQQFKKWLTPLNLNVVCLSAKLNNAERAETLQAIASGQAHCIVGTHSLFQQSVEFNHLGLVMIDEQHRFGVKQRQALYQKGAFAEAAPHLLTISATPIPRTLAMVFYADLDLSIISDMPPGRVPVKTVALAKSKRHLLIEKLSQRLAQSEQAFWITTLIDANDTVNRQAANTLYEDLCQQMPNQRIGLVHGQLSAVEKEQVMQCFHQGEIDLLVATTVVEVGVDVPNATMMVIEDPENLGLAQLHQLRGRVGRGGQAGYCVLLHGTPLSDLAHTRLNALRTTHDGFALAQIDLAERGPGDLLGAQQSGMPTFRYVDLTRDAALLEHVKAYADELIFL